MRNFFLISGELLIIAAVISAFFTESISNNLIFMLLSGIGIITLWK